MLAWDSLAWHAVGGTFHVCLQGKLTRGDRNRNRKSKNCHGSACSFCIKVEQKEMLASPGSPSMVLVGG